MTRDARIVAGVTLLTVPTILYGGLVLLGIVTRGGAGAPGSSLITSCARRPAGERIFACDRIRAG